MADTRTKYVAPSVHETAFNCPYCGALAKQFWFSGHAEPLGKDTKPPIWTPDEADNFDISIIQDREQGDKFRGHLRKLAKGLPFIEPLRKHVDYTVQNLTFSRCYNCDETSIWIYDRLVYPAQTDAPPPNPDLSADVRRDYNEAAEILALSPRGAAALLRLCIQKLCGELGGTGKDLNADIATLVKNGLDVRVQQALDVVRVIGNNAVHPGMIDLKDDRSTAENLFSLVNLIADIMITQPKHVSAMFGGLPEGARSAIQKRDASKVE